VLETPTLEYYIMLNKQTPAEQERVKAYQNQSASMTHVSRLEWWWVILFSSVLIALLTLPYIFYFGASANRPEDTTFMGTLYQPTEGAVYLGRIGDGRRGTWLFTLNHTSEPHTGALLQGYYQFWGHVARIFNFTPLITFHIARLISSLIMFLALYHLGATIWKRLRPRRMFFALLALGGGFGWLFSLLNPGQPANTLPVDLAIPEAIPFQSALFSAHFPVVIALVASLAAIFTAVFRPGFTTPPKWVNGGGSVIALTVFLLLIHPQSWLVMAVTLAAYVVIMFLRRRRLPKLELDWVLLMILPGLPILLYYFATFTQNAVMRQWNEQNLLPSPAPDKLIFGYGLLLLLALPGIWRAFRRFERDGDRLMIIWLVANLLFIYLPLNFQGRFAITLILPVGYFTVRALEDFWLPLLSDKLKPFAIAALFLLVIPSNVYAYVQPLTSAANTARGLEAGILLPSNYVQAVFWANRGLLTRQIMLAPEHVSLWIPAFSGLRVVYGHPTETLDAKQKQNELRAWYNNQTCDAAGNNCRPITEAECTDFLARYQVRYVLIQKPNYAPATCLPMLGAPANTFGDVAIYLVR
jgi:hypothetical protein